MKNALILHGTGDSPEGHWYPWLRSELEKRGWTVFAPSLPDSAHPDAARWNASILSSGWKPDTDSVVIGHSSGAVEILRLLPALPAGTRIKAAVLVSAFREDLGKHLVRNLFVVPFDWQMLPVQLGFGYLLARGKASLGGMFKTPFDFDAIKARASRFLFVHADDDPYCPLPGAKYLSEKLGGEFVLLRGGKHFSISTAGEKSRQFPELLEIIERL